MSSAVHAPGLRGRARAPLYRNGYLLILSSAASSGLGLVYWLVAARSFSARDLGLSAGLISATTLLASLAQLNLKGALNRFLPTAGAGAAALTLRAYAVALTLAGAAAFVFLAVAGTVAPDLAPLLSDPALAAWFVLATMAWTVFVLQDSVLAGIRQAGLVPVENVVFAVAKIGIVVALASVAPVTGPFISWTVPVVLLIVPVNVIVFRRLMPAHVAATAGRERSASRARIARYLAVDSVAYGIWTATVGVCPLLVLALAGPAAGAEFFVCWSITYGLYLVSLGMCQSLLAEGSLEPAALEDHARRIVRDSLGLVAVGAVAVCVLAEPLLTLFGTAYADGAVDALRALVLSAVPFVYTSVRINVARVRGAMRNVVATYAALAVLVFALGVPWLDAAGIAGLGWAWLVAQTVVALGLFVGGRSGLTVGPRARLVRRLAGGAAWDAPRALRRGGDVTVLGLGPAGAAPAAILRLPRNRYAEAALERQARALGAVGHHPFAPALVAHGRYRRRRYSLESALAGTDAAQRPTPGLTAAVAQTLQPLYAETTTTRTVDEALLTTWVRTPLATLRAALPRRHHPRLAALGAELEAGLAGRRLECCAVHGDLWPGNVLLDASGSVSGVIDWETFAAVGLREVDLMHLSLTTAMQATGRELGAEVVDRLDAPADTDGELSTRTLVLLVWLGHVAANLRKSPRYGRHPVWLRRNVADVLTAAAR